MKITLEDIFNIPTAVIYYPDKYKSASSVSIDTRTMKKNSLFVAIKGKNFDGHNYVRQAVKKGAVAVVVNNRKLSEYDKIKIPIISVRNTIKAYATLARIWRDKYKGKVISITGSNGKTTTKEILAELLSVKYNVYKTFANNNNQIGVPLTILSTPPNSDFIVLEHGTNHFGEIKFTAEIARPDIALITNVGNSHNEYLGTKENILKEKKELFDNCNKDGTIFINNDDQLISRLKQYYTNTITFGFKGRCDVKGALLKNKDKNKQRISIKGFGKSIESTLPLIGDANVKNYLAAAAIGLKCGLTKSDILKQSKNLKSVKGRFQIKYYPDFLLIDDTYNSNPDSVNSALNTMKSFDKSYRRILILGDMFELGDKSDFFHKEIAKKINDHNIHEVYSIGKRSKLLNDQLNGKIVKRHFNSRTQLLNFINQMDVKNSIILVKGSRGMKMEEFVNSIEMRVK